MGFIDNISTFGASVDSLFFVVLIFTGIAFILVEALLIYFLIRYRHREGRKAEYTHGNQRLEILWTIIPGLLLFALAIFQYGSWTRIKIDQPLDPDLTISLEGKQFEWLATYPGDDGEFGTADDIEAPANLVHVPVNQMIVVNLTAQDILHSFFVPVLRVKQDAVPGTTIPVWFEANQTGQFEIVCAELCGLGHYRMRGQLIVESEADFNAWLAEIASR